MWTLSCGSSSYIAISSSTTSRSSGVYPRVGRAEQHLRQEVEGLGMGVEESRVEVRRLLAGGRVHRPRRGRRRSPRSRSPRSRSVPLKSRCSRKCETPACAGVSSSRTCANPETQGDRAHRGDGRGWSTRMPGVELAYLSLVGGRSVGLSDPGHRRARDDDRRRHARACARRHRDRRCHDGGSGGPGRRCRRRRAPPPTCPRRRGPG